MTARLTHALETGALVLPEGRIAVFAPSSEIELSALQRAQVTVISRFAPDVLLWEQRGYEVRQSADGDFAVAFVALPRAKEAARAMLAEAAAVSDLLIVDGQKTDGIAPMIKALGAKARLDGTISKAHGKLIWCAAPDLTDWAGRPRDVGGFITRPGVFSADGPDKGSVALAEALPDVAGHVVDLGAGWGFLSRRILASGRVTKLDLVEADLTALDCARDNIDDARAAFHWADARTFKPAALVDVVVTNPPFHKGRAGEPDLGRAFIDTAAKILKPGGQLWLVANRHLPYEERLSERFREVSEVGGTSGFKVIHAAKPHRHSR